MGRAIAVKIDVTKIDKEHLYKGTKATYLDIILREKDEPDKYGNNFMVVQSVSNEASEAGERGCILGNGKYLGGGSSRPKQEASRPPQSDADDGIPF